LIEYPDYDEYDVSETVIDATVTVQDNAWIVNADGFKQEQTFHIIEERDKIMVAPVGKNGPKQSRPQTMRLILDGSNRNILNTMKSMLTPLLEMLLTALSER